MQQPETEEQQYTSVEGVLVGLTSQRPTPAGNPRWSLNVDGRSFWTMDDSDCALLVESSHAGHRVRVVADRLGRVSSYEVLEEQ